MEGQTDGDSEEEGDRERNGDGWRKGEVDGGRDEGEREVGRNYPRHFGITNKFL